MASLLLFLQIGFAPIVIWVWSVTTVFFVTSVVLFRVLRLQDNAGVDFQFMKKYFAEFIGTFALVFAGTGAIVVNEISGGLVTHVGVALTFGLVVLAMIYTLGDISGAHINPAVTVGFWFSQRLPGREVLPYFGSQFAGALAASGVMRLLFPQSALLGSTIPAGSDLQSFVLELLLTAILMFVILGVSTGAREKGITQGLSSAP